MINMKEKIRKLYPIILPPACIIAGILSIIFFCVGPVGKGQYDILAIGIICIVAALIAIILGVIDYINERKNKGK